LGFFHAPIPNSQHAPALRFHFQFPLLGIFPCTPTPFVAYFVDWGLLPT
jgi:hypothetical protein